jgi:DnaJ-class molecular chaperone
MANENGSVQCHYDVLGCALDDDVTSIKKKHRKLVLKYHPDKNLGDETAADKFMLVQRAYEVLSGEFVVVENARIKNNTFLSAIGMFFV